MTKNSKNERISVRVSQEEKKLVEDAAAKSYRSVADYVRGIVLVEAERVMSSTSGEK